MIELQAGGACYSWRLPPPIRFGGVSPLWSPQEDCAVLQRSNCEGYCAHPARAAKSNSSWARLEEQQVVRPNHMLELNVSTPRGRACLESHHKQEDRWQPWNLSQWGLAWWQPSEPRDKIIMSTFVFLLVCILYTQACIFLLIYCAWVVSLVIS